VQVRISEAHLINCRSEAANPRDSRLVKHSLDSESVPSFNMLRRHIWRELFHKRNAKEAAPNSSLFRSSKLARATATKSANSSIITAAALPAFFNPTALRVTRQGRRVFASQLRGWREFVAGLNRITEAENA
jgi:hypothetical protein